MKNKKAISSAIKIVLIVIAILAALSLVILSLLWARSSGSPPIMVGDKPIREACMDVNFQADYNSSNGEVLLTNIGSVDIYAFGIEEETSGGTTVIEKRAQDIATGAETNLRTGASGKINLDLTPEIEKVIVKPILLGLRGEVNEKYVCDNHPGAELEI